MVGLIKCWKTLSYTRITGDCCRELMYVITKNSKICKIASLRLWDEAGHTGTEVPWNRSVDPGVLCRGLIQGTASVKLLYTKCRVSANLMINFGKSLAALNFLCNGPKGRVKYVFWIKNAEVTTRSLT